MPSNYTPNYQLNQWEGSDAVLRTDFNADNAKLDAAIKAVDQRVDGKADTSALSSLSSQISSLSSTVSSHTSSLSSHSGSIAKLGNCQVYTTTYSGDGAASKALSFSGYPVLVYIQEASGISRQVMLRGTNRPAGSYDHVTIPLTWSSRGVSWTTGPNTSVTLPFNHSGTTYAVLALLDMSK